TAGRSEAGAIELGRAKVFITLHGASFNATSYHLVRRRGKGGPLPLPLVKRGPSDRSDSAQSVVVPRVVLGRPTERAVASVREVARVPDLGLGVCRAHSSARFRIRRGHLHAAADRQRAV